MNLKGEQTTNVEGTIELIERMGAGILDSIEVLNM